MDHIVLRKLKMSFCNETTLCYRDRVGGAQWENWVIIFVYPEGVIPAIGTIQLEKAIQNLSLTVAEVINDNMLVF